MIKDEQLNHFCSALHDLKKSLFTDQLKSYFEQTKSITDNELHLRAIRDICSRFLIDVYDVLDRASKDIQDEKTRNLYWETIHQFVSDNMDHWLKELSSTMPIIKKNLDQLTKDLEEFHSRGIHFHKERQRISFSLKS